MKKYLLFVFILLVASSCFEDEEECDVTLKFINYSSKEINVYVDFVLNGSSHFDLAPNSSKTVKLDNSLFSEHYLYYEWFSDYEEKMVRNELTIQTECGYYRVIDID